jgi:hypothetical protein
LLPTAHSRNLDRNDQQFVLSSFAGIASNLCALLLSEGRLHEAVECLEQGRAVIISRVLDDRDDIYGLRRDYPTLAQRYQSLVAEVNTSFGTAEDDSITTAKMMRRRETVTELEACLQDIRATPSHHRFLLGQTVAQMQEDICEGCIIIVNISTIRSNAIVMARASLQAISLPKLSLTHARHWIDTDWTVGKRSDQALLPRVWWIGCGLASSMPFHAADIHAHSSEENAFSRAISSHTPSVKALGYARRRTKHAQSDRLAREQMLVTLMPTTLKASTTENVFVR